MRYTHACFLPFLASGFLLVAGCSPPEEDAALRSSREAEIRRLTAQMTAAEEIDNLVAYLMCYDPQAVVMPEFQPALEGVEAVRTYYRQIFARQQVQHLENYAEEFIHLDSAVVEIGAFEKTYCMDGVDSLIHLKGKYCRLWRTGNGAQVKIIGEVFGFFHPVDNPRALVVKEAVQPAPPYHPEDIPLELRAYNALIAKYVSEGAGALRAGFYADDGKFFPFARPPVSGMAEIRPYLIRYDTHGPGFKMDTISVYTWKYEYHGQHVLEYSKFFVRWSAPGAKGGAEGKGIRVWRREKTGGLKFVREIGGHDYIEG
jgi:ketosteroid isomerase-like protein